MLWQSICYDSQSCNCMAQARQCFHSGECHIYIYICYVFFISMDICCRIFKLLANDLTCYLRQYLTFCDCMLTINYKLNNLLYKLVLEKSWRYPNRKALFVFIPYLKKYGNWKLRKFKKLIFFICVINRKIILGSFVEE